MAFKINFLTSRRSNFLLGDKFCCTKPSTRLKLQETTSSNSKYTLLKYFSVIFKVLYKNSKKKIILTFRFLWKTPSRICQPNFEGFHCFGGFRNWCTHTGPHYTMRSIPVFLQWFFSLSSSESCLVMWVMV